MGASNTWVMRWAEALAWDQSFANCNDPSGRAVLGVHNTDLTHEI